MDDSDGDATGGTEESVSLSVGDSCDETEKREAAPVRSDGEVGLGARRAALRCGSTVMINIIAGLIPNVTEVAGIVGAVFMSLIAFVLPAVFDIKARQFQLTYSEWAIDALLLAVGISGF